jgi:hypothetical protein
MLDALARLRLAFDKEGKTPKNYSKALPVRKYNSALARSDAKLLAQARLGALRVDNYKFQFIDQPKRLRPPSRVRSPRRAAADFGNVQ